MGLTTTGFASFRVVNLPMPGTGLGILGLTNEGFPALVSIQQGTGGTRWVYGQVNGSLNPLLPNVTDGLGRPVRFSTIEMTTGWYNGQKVPQVIGLGLDDGLLYLACVYDSVSGQWQAGFALPQTGSPPVAFSSFSAIFDEVSTLLVFGIGRHDQRAYLAAASWFQGGENGVWSPGQLISTGLTPDSPNYSGIVTGVASYANGSLPPPILAVTRGTDGHNYRVFLSDPASQSGPFNPFIALTENDPNSQIPSPLRSGQPISFSSLAFGNDLNSGTLCLFGLDATYSEPYLANEFFPSAGAGEEMTSSVGPILPNASIDGQPGTYSTIVPFSSPLPDRLLGLVGLGLEDHQPYLACSGILTPSTQQGPQPDPTAGGALPNCSSYGRLVMYSDLAVGGDAQTNQHVFGLGLDDGQIYHICWLSSSGEWQPGQGLLPSVAGSNWKDARAFASMMVSDPGVMSAFNNSLQRDLEATPKAVLTDFPTTRQFIASQFNPMTGLKLRCTLADVTRAVRNLPSENINMWAGLYAAVNPGPGWPQGVLPQYIYVTGVNSVFYGGVDLGTFGWTFSGGCLTWQSSGQFGGPPVPGSIQFSVYTPDAPGPGGYVGPYFTGTLNGILSAGNFSPPTAPPLPPLPPALKSLTLGATTLEVGQVAQITVTLDAAAPYGGTVVGLWTDNTSFLVVPDSVVVPMGSTEATINTLPFQPPYVTGESMPATIYAVTGFVAMGQRLTLLMPNTLARPAASSALNLEETTQPDFSLTLSPASVLWNQPCQATVTLNSPASSDMIFNMSSSVDGLANLPAMLTVAANQTVGWVAVKLTEPQVNQIVTITATDPNGISVEQQLTILTDLTAPSVSWLSFDPASVTEGDSIQATVLLTYAPNSDTQVSISSDQPLVLPSPPSVIIPANTRSASVPMISKPVVSTTTVNFTAQAVGQGIAPYRTNVQVLPLPPSPQLTTNPLISVGGGPVIATLTLGAALRVETNFTLTSFPSWLAAVNPPSTMSIPANMNSGSWSLTAVNPSSYTQVPLQVFVGPGSGSNPLATTQLGLQTKVSTDGLSRGDIIGIAGFCFTVLSFGVSVALGFYLRYLSGLDAIKVGEKGIEELNKKTLDIAVTIETLGTRLNATSTQNIASSQTEAVEAIDVLQRMPNSPPASPAQNKIPIVEDLPTA